MFVERRRSRQAIEFVGILSCTSLRRLYSGLPSRPRCRVSSLTRMLLLFAFPELARWTKSFFHVCRPWHWSCLLRCLGRNKKRFLNGRKIAFIFLAWHWFPWMFVERWNGRGSGELSKCLTERSFSLFPFRRLTARCFLLSFFFLLLHFLYFRKKCHLRELFLWEKIILLKLPSTSFRGATPTVQHAFAAMLKF